MLSDASPRFTALNMRITELIEDYGLVGFETLAVEVGSTASIMHVDTTKIVLSC